MLFLSVTMVSENCRWHFGQFSRTPPPGFPEKCIIFHLVGFERGGIIWTEFFGFPLGKVFGHAKLQGAAKLFGRGLTCHRAKKELVVTKQLFVLTFQKFKSLGNRKAEKLQPSRQLPLGRPFLKVSGSLGWSVQETPLEN